MTKAGLKIEIEKAIAYYKGDQWLRDLLMGEERYLFIPGVVLGTGCAYVIDMIKYNPTDKIISGRPVVRLPEEDMTVIEAWDDATEQGSEGLYFVSNDYTFVCPILAELTELSDMLEGLAKGSFVGEECEDADFPEFMLEIDYGSLTQCFCTNTLNLPLHLLPQLARSGFTRERGGCKVILKQTGSFNLNYIANTKDDEEGVAGYRQYRDLLQQGRHIRVYLDKLTVYMEKDDSEHKYVDDFYYTKFYDSPDELAKCLLLTNYDIVVPSQVTQALIDIYYEELN